MMGTYSPRADETSASDGDFMNKLNDIKSPFEDGIPKPVIIPPPVVVHHQEPIRIKIELPKPHISLPQPVIQLPELKVQGVVVGDDVHQAIINDQIVPLLGFIDGVQLIDVSKQGVELLFKGKKFFLKVD